MIMTDMDITTPDSLGYITEIIDGKGNKTEYTLDLWGKKYDYAGNLTAVIDGNGNVTRYNLL